MQPIDQLLLECCKKALHPRVIKAAMCSSHALPNDAMLRDQRAVFPAGILAAIIGMQDHPCLIRIPGHGVAQRIAAQAGTHVRAHGITNHRAIETIQNRGKIQLQQLNLTTTMTSSKI